MDTEEMLQDVVERVRDAIAQAEEKAAQIVRDAEEDAKRIRADADAQARKRLDEVREGLARLESSLGSEPESGSVAEVEPERAVASRPKSGRTPRSGPPSDDRASTEELIDKLKRASS